MLGSSPRGLTLTCGVFGIAFIGLGIYAYFAERAIQEIGIVGSVASVLGIIYTVYQIGETKRLARDAKTAADAAKEASEAATAEMKAGYYRYSLLEAKRILAEAQQWVFTKKWPNAAVRASDMSNQASLLAYARPNRDEEWIQARDRLHDWANIFRAIHANRNLDRPVEDWNQLCAVLRDKIDRECGPFSVMEEVE